MKIKREEPTFQPIVITLESLQELQELYAILNNTIIVPTRSPLHELYSLLANIPGESGYESGYNKVLTDQLSERLSEHYRRSPL